jgi:hypothetical protein
MARPTLADVRRVLPLDSDLATDIQRAQTIAKLLDAQFVVGGVRFGLSALVDLIPVAGDTATAIIGLYPIYVAQKHGLGKAVIVRMLMNLGVEWGVGLVPVVGDAADIFLRANLKNVSLLKKAAAKKGWRPT